MTRSIYHRRPYRFSTATQQTSCCRGHQMTREVSAATVFAGLHLRLSCGGKDSPNNHLSRGARERGLGLCGRRSPRLACASDGALRVRCGFRFPRRPLRVDSPLADPACSLSELAAEKLSAAAAAAAVAAASASSSACGRAATVVKCCGQCVLVDAAGIALKRFHTFIAFHDITFKGAAHIQVRSCLCLRRQQAVCRPVSMQRARMSTKTSA